MKVIKIIFIAGLMQLVVGCSINAPQYAPDFDSINGLKEANVSKLGTGEFKEFDPSLNKISLRGSSLNSPYGGSYSNYLKNAVEEQLKHASRWDEASQLRIEAVLLANSVDASGFSIGEADLSAEFILSDSGKKLYQKIHSIHHQWPSSFVGAIAIPNATNNYTVAVQKLVSSLFSDPEFLELIKK